MMNESNTLCPDFLRKVSEQLFLNKNDLLKKIQQKALEEQLSQTKYYLSYWHSDKLDVKDNECVTIDCFSNLLELWEAYTEPFDSYHRHRTMVHDEYEELIRDYILDVYQNLIQTFPLSDIQMLFNEQGYDCIDSMEEALDNLYECFDHEIWDQVCEYMDEFGSIPIDLLLNKDTQQTEQLKRHYEQLIPDTHLSEKLNLMVKSFMTEQKNELVPLIKKDMLSNQTALSSDALIQKYVNYSLDLLISPFSLEEFFHLLKLEDVSIDEMIIIDHKTVFPLIKSTLLFKSIKQTLSLFLRDIVEKELPERISVLKETWFLKAMQLYEFTKLHPISSNTMKTINARLSELKDDDQYYYLQFQYEQKAIFKQLLAYIQDLHIYELNIKYDSDIYPKNIQLTCWFSELSDTEREFLRSKEFIGHLKNISIEVFGKDLSISYLSKRMAARQFILHIGPTNSGKTHAALLDLKSSQSGIYLAPLRMLALEKFEELNRAGIPCSLKTGEEHQEMRQAQHLSSTVEAADFQSSFETAVIDECQMIAEPQRGFAWTKALLGIQARRVHIIASPHAEKLLKKIFDHYHFSYELVYHHRRTSLEMEPTTFHFPKDVRAADALIVFSKRKVLNAAAQLLKNGHKVSVLYGSMPPETRRMQMDQYREGRTDVLVSTDAIGMGLNLPVNRVVFLETEKFDGKSVRSLDAAEVKQIAGRAGRQGIFENGLVNTAKNRKKIAQLLKKEVQPLSKALLPFPTEKVSTFPYQSFDLFMTTWKLYQSQLDDLPYDIDSADSITELYRRLHPYLKRSGLAPIPLVRIVKYCSLPFSIKNDSLSSYWMQLIVQYEKDELIFAPSLSSSRSVDVLEEQYEQLSLYSSFMRLVDASFDEHSVQKKKQEIAATIFDELSKNLKQFSKKCSSCGNELAWNFPHSRCDRCYRRSYYDYEEYDF
ncbi:hypothetical protein J2S09_000785 [Bacillus fengqiuensis]|nr:hypothetical protein [Bacillus fengqiuensis]